MVYGEFHRRSQSVAHNLDDSTTDYARQSAYERRLREPSLVANYYSVCVENRHMVGYIHRDAICGERYRQLHPVAYNSDDICHLVHLDCDVASVYGHRPQETYSVDYIAVCAETHHSNQNAAYVGRHPKSYLAVDNLVDTGHLAHRRNYEASVYGGCYQEPYSADSVYMGARHSLTDCMHQNVVYEEWHQKSYLVAYNLADNAHSVTDCALREPRLVANYSVYVDNHHIVGYIHQDAICGGRHPKSYSMDCIAVYADRHLNQNEVYMARRRMSYSVAYDSVDICHLVHRDCNDGHHPRESCSAGYKAVYVENHHLNQNAVYAVPHPKSNLVARNSVDIGHLAHRDCDVAVICGRHRRESHSGGNRLVYVHHLNQNAVYVGHRRD